jgi:hypothetical protein
VFAFRGTSCRFFLSHFSPTAMPVGPTERLTNRTRVAGPTPKSYRRC